MNHRALYAFIPALLAATAGCDPREEPILCVVAPFPEGAGGSGAAGDTADVTLGSLGCDPASEPAQGAAEPDTGPETSGKAICRLHDHGDGDAFVLLHELPEGVEPIGKLKVHIETPCKGEDRDIEVSHAGRTALLTGVVPPGGACAFVVTATMANSELRCESLAATPCTPACEPAPR